MNNSIRKQFTAAAALFLVLAGLSAGSQPAGHRDQAPVPQSAELAQAIAAARRNGYPVSAKDLQADLPPEVDNAAPIYLTWEQMKKSGRITSKDDISLYAVTDPTASEAKFVEARRAYAANGAAYELIHTAVKRAKCVYKKDYSLGPAVIFPEFSTMRQAARFASAESALALHDGNYADAIQDAANVFAISKQVAQGQGQLSALVSYAIDRMALIQLRNILYAAGDKPDVREGVLAALAKRMKPVQPALALHSMIARAILSADTLKWSDEKIRSEFGIHGTDPVNPLDILRSLSSINELTQQDLQDEVIPVVLPIIPAAPSRSDRAARAKWADANALLAVTSLQKLLDAAGGPFDQRYRAAASVCNSLRTMVTKELMKFNPSTPSSTPIACLYAESAYEFIRQRSNDYETARGDILTVACDLFAYRKRTGAFPDNLSAASLHPALDPFDGKPLKYRREGDGFVLYAVGRNHRYDGGKPGDVRDRGEAMLRYIPAASTSQANTPGASDRNREHAGK